jgi:hypothetical protein
MLTRLEYDARLIKEESTSELLRFTIRHILKHIGNDQIYHYLKQQQQKKAQNNQHQKQFHDQFSLNVLFLLSTSSLHI